MEVDPSVSLHPLFRMLQVRTKFLNWKTLKFLSLHNNFYFPIYCPSFIVKE